ncbi:asparagine synthase-related protein [Vibrio breoganii]
MFDYYECLGSRSYYYTPNNLSVYTSITDYFRKNNHDTATIDEVAILGVLMKNYVIGDRTLIQGLSRTPWMSKQAKDGSWISADLPKHGNSVASAIEASERLFISLRDEVLRFVENKKTVGILLSGGMDSRIVAGILRRLQESKEYSGRVVALTWGIPESRDVIYAQRIAGEFNWDFRHFELNSEVLASNIRLTAERGAEYSPVHLHAMEAVSKVDDVDGIIAGSYGDSIGRGEYSGRRTDKLPGILDKHLHHFAFLLKNVEVKSLPKIKQDLAAARSRFPGRSEMAYREIEMQMHYMRRQLNSCMEVIDDRIPLYQMFSAPSSFGYMWSLKSENRTDDVYEYLLKALPRVLQHIPWARTGKKYNHDTAKIEDSHTSLNNRYGLWLRQDLRTQIIESINSGALQSLGVFNDSSLKMWTRYWSQGNSDKADRLDEKMAWLASLSMFVENYDIKPSRTLSTPKTFMDTLSQAKAYVHTTLYHEALKRKK